MNQIRIKYQEVHTGKLKIKMGNRIRKDMILVEDITVHRFKSYIRKGKTHYQNRLNIPPTINPGSYDIILIPRST